MSGPRQRVSWLWRWLPLRIRQAIPETWPRRHGKFPQRKSAASGEAGQKVDVHLSF